MPVLSQGSIALSRPRFLELARHLALAFCTAVPGLVACTTSQTPVASGTSPSSASASAEPTGQVSGDPTAGTEPCRCSWETNTAIATRVCRKGEIAVDGKTCIAGLDHGGSSTGEGGMAPMPMPVPGPQAPPDLPRV